MKRRELLTGGLVLALGGTAALAQTGAATGGMYGLIGKLRAAPGRRDALIEAILSGSDAMPGCLSYIVAADAADADLIWITEVWDSRESHAGSLRLPDVQAAIARARPLIAGFEPGAETRPVGGFGLARRPA